ncbi:hypothetical protein BJ508DRAFT_13650 [Ascobolus immersus RN42]|uniref:Uncharacterized protein n=1 Tax=Ascobolus immersus RN42 TaxID=1160509 RepID=A0A3N4ILY6_ASCIM|nr:hypothetical protein BJ508DRAFT_13650 [Ascobolus immersus RN42]
MHAKVSLSSTACHLVEPQPYYALCAHHRGTSAMSTIVKRFIDPPLSKSSPFQPSILLAIFSFISPLVCVARHFLRPSSSPSSHPTKSHQPTPLPLLRCSTP